MGLEGPSHTSRPSTLSVVIHYLTLNHIRSFAKEIIFSFSAGFLFIKKKKCMRRSPSGQRREVQGLIPQGFGSSNLPLRIVLPVVLYVTSHLYGVGCERRV